MRSVSPVSIGTSVEDFHFANVGKRRCELAGYPTLHEQLTNGKTIKIKAGHENEIDGIRSPVVLMPGQHAGLLHA